MAKKHYLRHVWEEVDKTHPKLGRGVVVAMLAVKARKLLLIVSPRGCGKSRISSFVGNSAPVHMTRDRLSVAGLSTLQDELNGFEGVIVVDDIAKTQTAYARINTITTLAELVYSHYCSSNLAKMVYDIRDFYGSAIVNVQPVLLRKLVESNEWEASIQDKSIRFYHLHRPLNPNPDVPKVELTWGTNLAEVNPPRSAGALSLQLQKVAEPQWGRSRLFEHIGDLLRAAAALDGRKVVRPRDYHLLIDALKPMQVEALVMDKRDFESQRYLYSNKLAVMTEYITYGQFTLRQLADDYKVSQSQAYRLMNVELNDWRIVAKSPTTYAPSDNLYNELRRLSLV